MYHTRIVNINQPFVGLYQVVHVLERWHPGTLFNKPLVEQYKFNMCRALYESIIYPLVGLDLVDIDDVDRYVLEPSDNSGSF